MIKVQTEDFDIGVETARLTDGNNLVGGLACFVGLVRDIAGDDSIETMTLEHYPGMTERQLEKIEGEARERWNLLDTLIIHRYGTLAPGDRIVMVAATSEHRQDALESCNFLIDWLKTKAPFWKLEATSHGKHWVEARAEDRISEERWVIGGQNPE